MVVKLRTPKNKKIGTFGDINVDGTGESWEYMDSWAYKVNDAWTYGTVNCTDGSTTTCDSSCPYPFAACPNTELITFLSTGVWRYQYEVAGYRLPSVTTILGRTKDDTFLKDWIKKKGKKEAELKWEIANGEIHIKYENGFNESFKLIYRINKDRSITWIADIDKDGEREDYIKVYQSTYKKIK